MHACMRGQWLQPCPTFCDTMDCSPPGFSVCGILQTRILEWVAMPSSRGSSPLRDRTCISFIFCTSGRFFLPTEPPGKPKFNAYNTLHLVSHIKRKIRIFFPLGVIRSIIVVDCGTWDYSQGQKFMSPDICKG